MLEQLQGHLSKIIKNIKGQGKISESNISDVLRDIRIALLEADVNLKVAKKFVEHVKEKALGEKVLNSVSPGQQFTKILFDELKYFLGDDSKQLEFDSSGQTIIVLAGLQGCGKTTTCGKIARFLKKFPTPHSPFAQSKARRCARARRDILGAGTSSESMDEK